MSQFVKAGAELYGHRQTCGVQDLDTTSQRLSSRFAAHACRLGMGWRG